MATRVRLCLACRNQGRKRNPKKNKKIKNFFKNLDMIIRLF